LPRRPSCRRKSFKLTVSSSAGQPSLTLWKDMGLGKTLSTLALIAGSVARNGNRRRATLIVAPLSSMSRLTSCSRSETNTSSSSHRMARSNREVINLGLLSFLWSAVADRGSQTFQGKLTTVHRVSRFAEGEGCRIIKQLRCGLDNIRHYPNRACATR
jgi:hypothetical protein